MNRPGPITINSLVVASQDQVSSDLGGETVLLSLQNARYFGFQGVGARVWELVGAPVRVADVCAIVMREYDVPAARCEADVLSFLCTLADRGLLEVRVGG